MKKVYVSDFPKFKEMFWRDGLPSWQATFRANGFKSVIEDQTFASADRVLISDEEYTWFVLRWS
jgi:hypothetical protein